MTSKEIFDAGYAFPLYDIRNDVQHFQYRGERFMHMPSGLVPMHDIGLGFKVALIEDVRKHV